MIGAPMTDTTETSGPGRDDAITTLVGQHREFLAFVERRVRDRALAEDLLQQAFVRGLERVGQLRESESARAWFYRVLRNAILDHQRREAAAQRRLEVAAELERAAAQDDAELERVACACVAQLAGTLDPKYATALRRVEVDGLPVVEFAREAGITANNAGVRLHRAREALRRQVARACGTCAEHGCVDCSCRRPGPGAAGCHAPGA